MVFLKDLEKAGFCSKKEASLRSMERRRGQCSVKDGSVTIVKLGSIVFARWLEMRKWSKNEGPLGKVGVVEVKLFKKGFALRSQASRFFPFWFGVLSPQIGLLALRSPPIMAPSKLFDRDSNLFNSEMKVEVGELDGKYTEPNKYLLIELSTSTLTPMNTEEKLDVKSMISYLMFFLMINATP